MAGNEVILLNRGCMGEPYVIENVCFVGSDESVDITIEQGRIADVRSSEKSVDKASKTWVIPGLWDCHTHFTQWSYTLGRLDLIDARSADEAMSLLREHLEERRESGTLDPDQYVVGMRFRHSLWADDAQPTLAAIDAVSGDQPVALSSADMHCGWVNSAAARKLGVHVGESGLVGELEWFDAYCKLDKGPGAADELMRLLRNAEQDAAGKGVVGVRDYEMAENIDTWIDRFKQGLDGLRIEAGVYPERLQQAIDDGWHTGDELPGSHGLGHVGAMEDDFRRLAQHPIRLLLHTVFGHYAGNLRHAELHPRANRIVYAARHRTWLRHRLPCHRRRSEHHRARLRGTVPTRTAPSSMPKCSRNATFHVLRNWDLPRASSHSTPWTTVTSSHDSGAIPPEFPTRSTVCTSLEPNCLWARTRRSRRWIRGWPFPQRCSARRVPIESLSSLSNVWISKPLSLRPPPWGVRRCKLEMRQT